MSVHYVIDGYNIVKQVPHLTSQKLKSARDGLIQLIKKYRLTGSSRNKVSIVFDGRQDVFSARTEREFEIIFAKGESADDKIKKIITSSSNPSVLIIVSDDKELVFFAKNHRADVCSVAEFLSKISKSKDRKKVGDDDFKISTAAARGITAELKKIWIKKK